MFVFNLEATIIGWNPLDKYGRIFDSCLLRRKSILLLWSGQACGRGSYFICIILSFSCWCRYAKTSVKFCL